LVFFERKYIAMNMELYEIYAAIAKVSDALMENQIEFTFDALSGVIGACNPSDSLDMILCKIDWDTPSPDMDKVTEAYDDLIEFNECFNIKELEAPIEKLNIFLSANK
jgi:hypothetical protein